LDYVITVLGIGVLIGSSLLTEAARRAALAQGRLDVPGQRSSHSVPTPRGGGVGIVISASAGFLVLAALHRLPVPTLLGLLGGIPIAIVGYVDDRKSTLPIVRLIVHLGSAAWALSVIGGVPQLQVGDTVLALPGVLAALAIAWSVNLFNFMDGIDGIAAAEGICMMVGALIVGLLSGHPSDLAGAEGVLTLASLGFLMWNWPPARIFMGDVGSGYLGYVIAVMALSAGRENPVGLYCWLTLGGVFFADATVTLLTRALRGKRLHEPHRSHAYQRLARRWCGHLPVTGATVVVNLAWLLPLALLETVRPRYAWLLTLIGLAPLVGICLFVGAGRSDN
jgi:Fuc2NAc and GlcNAc transferase